MLSELQGLAKKMDVTLPGSPDAMQRQQARQLEADSGTTFDQAYVQGEIKGHQMSIAQTQQETSSGSDQQVAQFAKSYLPVAEQHLKLVQHLSSPTNASQSSRMTTGSGG